MWPDAPTRYATDNPSVIHRSRGGSAANVAVFASASVPTRFIGCVGDDPAADVLTAELAGHGVDVRVQRRDRTGTIVVLIDRNGRAHDVPGPRRGRAADRRTGLLARVRRHAARAVVLLRGGAGCDRRPWAHPARGAGGHPRLARRFLHRNDRGVRPGPLPGPGGVASARGLLRQRARGRTARRKAPAVRQDHDHRQERRRVHDRDPARRRPADRAGAAGAAGPRLDRRRGRFRRRVPRRPPATAPTRWTRPGPATSWPVPSCSRPAPRPGAGFPVPTATLQE